MLSSAISALVIAWLLSLVGFDDMLIEVTEEWAGRKVSVATYYVAFFAIGLIAGIF